jgi:hypothetical protein
MDARVIAAIYVENEECNTERALMPWDESTKVAQE